MVFPSSSSFLCILSLQSLSLLPSLLSSLISHPHYPCHFFHQCSQANIGGETVPESEEPTILKSDKLRFSDAGLRLIGLDLLTGDVIWTLDPTLESGRKISLGSEQCEIEHSEECNGVLFAKIVTLHSSPQGSEISLLVSLVSGSTYVWNIDVATGSVSQENSKQLPGKYEGHLVGIMSMQRSGEASKGTSQFLLVSLII